MWVRSTLPPPEVPRGDEPQLPALLTCLMTYLLSASFPPPSHFLVPPLPETISWMNYLTSHFCLREQKLRQYECRAEGETHTHKHTHTDTHFVSELQRGQNLAYNFGYSFHAPDNLIPQEAEFLFYLFIYLYLFIYFWLCWVFVSVRGLSLVAASGGHSSSRCAGLSLSRPLLLWSTGSSRAGSVVVAYGPSHSAACGILPDQGSNPCPLHWQADSQPLHHQGSPAVIILNKLIC